jgi:diamine N-acetyltransferase
MLFTAKNNKSIFLRRLEIADLDNLSGYLEHLSNDTKKRFGPHDFSKPGIIDFFADQKNTGYIAIDTTTKTIIAYAVVKLGYLQHDSPRLQSYGIALDHNTDCSFAPSVADSWQSCGIGNSLLHFIISDVKATAIKRIILWGGVQANNDKAVNYYTRNGFKILGQFEYHGDNYDMILNIT